MVLTSCPSAITTSVVQAFTALPSRCTTQAPHCEVSQPTWVPVSRKFSRKNCTSSVRGSTLALTGLPFTIREILAISTLFICAAALHGSAAVKVIPGHNMGHPGNEQPHPGMTGHDKVTCRLALHGLGEIGEKFIGQFFGRTINQPLPELGQLAADLRLDV